jgi:GT2 family glycosyltransferase
MAEAARVSSAASAARSPLADAGVEQVATLGPRVLVAVGSFSETAQAELALVVGDRPLDAECHLLTFAAPQPDGTFTPKQLLCAVLRDGGTRLGGEPLRLRSGRKSVLLGQGTGIEAEGRGKGRLGLLVRRSLAPLDARTRNRVSDFLARVCATAIDGAGGLRVSERLFGIREALRERLPLQLNEPLQPRGLFSDRILAIDERAFYLRGWMRDEDSRAARLTVVSPEGARTELLHQLHRFFRPDVLEFYAPLGQTLDSKLGMLCYFEPGAPSLLTAGWILEMEEADGTAVQFPIPGVVREPEELRNTLLDDPSRQRLLDEEMMADNVKPALMRLQTRLEQTVTVETVNQYGTPPDSPEVSIVVPIYQHVEHLEMQIAEFANDPELKQSDLVYVLDSPEQADALDYKAGQLIAMYGLPFRTVVLDHNVGFAGANNAGVGLARGRLLLLLNSDVIPAAPGWLGAMRDFYDAHPDIGALGPKLLYEDDSIQHAGMYFHQPPGSSDWLDAHYFKGMHRTLPDANVARPVPAVSGACMMISMELYRSHPLRGLYVRGDYEDFDICMRLIEEERENWYVPEAELYHLEGQSYTSVMRVPANRYNMWLHTNLWSDRIESMMASGEYDPSGRRQDAAAPAEPPQ